MRALVIVHQLPTLRYNQKECLASTITVALITKYAEDCKEKAERLLRKFRRAKNMTINDVLETLEGCKCRYIRGMLARHIFGMLEDLSERVRLGLETADRGAVRLGLVAKPEMLDCGRSWGVREQYVLARALAVYMVGDLRNALGVEYNYHVTIFFKLRDDVYVYRGKVHRDILLDTGLQGKEEIFAEAIIRAGPASHTLQEVLLEEGVVKEIALSTYAGFMSRERWREVYRHIAESRDGLVLKDALRKVVRLA